MNEEIDNSKERKRTTVLLEGDAYTLIRKKQMKIFNETEKNVSIQDLVSQSIKKGLKVDELQEIDLKNLIYKDVIQILESPEHRGLYKGNSHHLTQKIVEKFFPNITEVIR